MDRTKSAVDAAIDIVDTELVVVERTNRLILSFVNAVPGIVEAREEVNLAASRCSEAMKGLADAWRASLEREFGL